MKVLELKSIFTNSLSDQYPSQEIQSFFGILCEKYLSLSRIDIAMDPEKTVSSEDFQRFQEAVLRLKKHEPIQYIIGETEFYSLPFRVNKHTLIPRPETEELVEWILSEQNGSVFQNNPLSILDIGTGSGCIAISLAKNLQNAVVHALDISSEALKVAAQNSGVNNVEIEFFQTDVLRTRSLPSDSQNVRYDIIVSNPPYVRELEKELMQPNVVDYEPETALFVKNEDPLRFYKAISHLAKNSLKPGGNLFFEINEQFARELEAYLKEESFKQIEVRQDIYGKDRMLKCNL